MAFPSRIQDRIAELLKLVRTMLVVQMAILPAYAAAEEKALPINPSCCYVDRYNRIIVDGEPFFPLGFYGGRNLGDLRELADSPFNCVLDYGMTAQDIETTRQYLDEAHRLGVKIIFCVNDVYPSAEYRKKLGEWVGNDAILEGVVKAFRDHPTLIAWYNNDELPFEKKEEIEGYYRRIKELDPHHPQLMVHYRPGSYRTFLDAYDIVGVDVYPIPKNPVTDLSDRLDLAWKEIEQKKPVWAVPQTFAWYQHRKAEDPNDTLGRRRLPVPNEWLNGRAPTYDETRAMTYLALVHRAKGILYWCFYNMTYLPDFVERWHFMKQIGEEVRALFPVLLSPQEMPCSIEPPNEAIHSLIKVADGKRYLLAVNGSREPHRPSFRLPEGVSSQAEVKFENRTIPVKDGLLTDFFAPLAAHVYELDRRAPTSISAIVAD
jgi:hypothetical protein